MSRADFAVDSKVVLIVVLIVVLMVVLIVVLMFDLVVLQVVIAALAGCGEREGADMARQLLDSMVRSSFPFPSQDAHATAVLRDLTGNAPWNPRLGGSSSSILAPLTAATPVMEDEDDEDFDDEDEGFEEDEGELEEEEELEEDEDFLEDDDEDVDEEAAGDDEEEDDDL